MAGDLGALHAADYAAGMLLPELARAVPGAWVDGDGGVEIGGVQPDSRRVKPGDLFVAVPGIRADGHAFIADAVAAGAAAVAVQSDALVPNGVAALRVPSTRSALGELAAEF